MTSQSYIRGIAISQDIDDMAASFATIVNFEGVAVRFVLHDNPSATIAQRVGQNAELLDAVGFVVDGTDDREPRA
ncbi:MAG: hypothetical protein ACREIF_07015 [Chthoniobacterales bacterium]